MFAIAVAAAILATSACRNGKETRAALALFLVGGAVVCVIAQSASDARVQLQLKQLFPSATAFSPKEGQPPRFSAYLTDAVSRLRTLGGVAFWTTDLEPLERAYDGPIKILVGMDTKGIITGVIVTEHHEPYGNFSIDLPQFAAQFKGKSIRDPFKVGADIDAVSRASISIASATRAIRNSARRMARQLPLPEAR
jgi:NosR/NirI family nitrous oxide reductase transcriptional regulator